ncbi:MAG TPA: hypothetical protein VIC57_16750 [Candidatus Dormibacteraeota bacterium]
MATQHDDSAALRHEHVWGEIQRDDPPGYLVAVHGPRAFADIDRRYRECERRGCDARVHGSDVEHPEVLAHVSADIRGRLDTTCPRLTSAGATG